MIDFKRASSASAGVVAVLFCFGCSSTDASTASRASGGAGGEAGPTASAGDSPAGGAAPVAEGGASAGGDASTQAGAAGQAATGASAHGHVDVVQSEVLGAFQYSVQGGFVRFAAAAAPANGVVCQASTMGDCLVSACTIMEVADPGTPPAATILDAGQLTVTGAGASKATLVFGTVSPQSTQPGYAAVSGDKQFFSGGDSITLAGAGGADLPAFKAQKLLAPSDLVLTAPACTLGGCPDLDRSKNLTVTWTSGGAGNVKASFETVGDTASAYVFCTFPASAGSGTVPKAALAELGDTRDGNTTGIEVFASENETSFDVAGVPTTFSLQTGAVQALMNISK